MGAFHSLKQKTVEENLQLWTKAVSMLRFFLEKKSEYKCNSLVSIKRAIYDLLLCLPSCGCVGSWFPRNFYFQAASFRASSLSFTIWFFTVNLSDKRSKLVFCRCTTGDLFNYFHTIVKNSMIFWEIHAQFGIPQLQLEPITVGTIFIINMR